MEKKAVMLAVLLGILVGGSAYTFKYAKGLSYFSTAPEACVNCHIMTPQYDSWQKSSHHAAAACIDCHLPHSLIRKYIAKAENGWRHAKAFTTGRFHEPIMIKEKNRRILQHNCVECHKEIVHKIFRDDTIHSDTVSCMHCHASAGHGVLPTSIGRADQE